MNKREFIQKSALLGFAASVSSMGSWAKAAAAISSNVNSASPRTAPPGGNLPVAFLLGKNAEVLDVTGPLRSLPARQPRMASYSLRPTRWQQKRSL